MLVFLQLNRDRISPIELNVPVFLFKSSCLPPYKGWGTCKLKLDEVDLIGNQ